MKRGCGGKRGNGGVVQLLTDGGGDKDKVDENGRTPILRAAWKGHGDVVRRLMELGADLNKADKYGRTGPRLLMTARDP